MIKKTFFSKQRACFMHTCPVHVCPGYSLVGLQGMGRQISQVRPIGINLKLNSLLEYTCIVLLMHLLILL